MSLKRSSFILNVFLWIVGVSVAYSQPAGWKWDSGDPSVQLQQGLFKQVSSVSVQRRSCFLDDESGLDTSTLSQFLICVTVVVDSWGVLCRLRGVLGVIVLN